MKPLVTAFLSALLPFAETQQKPIANHDPSINALLTVRHELIRAEIIPTVIDDFTPALLLSVRWGSADSNLTADLGNTLSPSALQSAPRLALHHDPASAETTSSTLMQYTVALTDPDAPSRDNPKWSEVAHWIATRVALSSSSSSSSSPSSEQRDVLPYKPPGPPPRTGKHRYVFVALAPANGTTAPLRLEAPEERKRWGTGEERRGVRDWAGRNGLVAVGANFVYAQNEEQ